jgi:hypothetical protein
LELINKIVDATGGIPVIMSTIAGIWSARTGKSALDVISSGFGVVKKLGSAGVSKIKDKIQSRNIFDDTLSDLNFQEMIPRQEINMAEIVTIDGSELGGEVTEAIEESGIQEVAEDVMEDIGLPDIV